MVKRLINITEASEHLGVQKSTLYSWVHQRLIDYIKVGRLVKFDLQDLDNWIEKHRIEAEKRPE